MKAIHPVILCGGSGTRLWPRSRKARPKPFLPLVGERTLFQQSLDRVTNGDMFAAPVIVGGESHRTAIADQLAGRPDVRMVVEPAARNTAPAIALAAHLLADDEVMLVCPSDHHIGDVGAFHDGVARAAELARAGYLVSFGIAPTSPETGYGYIRQGEPVMQGHRIDRFVEKPDRKTAEQFLAAGGYVWNGGIFAFTAGAFRQELERYRPEMAKAVAASMAGAQSEGGIWHPGHEVFAAIEGESIDYAVMENTERAAVVAADMGWSDIGNWQALKAARGGDADGNFTAGKVDMVDCRNVMAETDGPRISVVGLENVVIVVDGDEVLVTSSDGTQRVGTLPGASAQ